ncbi:M20 family metallo-hydrolase [Deinococcus cellulosilyticus]|uniref:Putative hydrolase n=1 Tax=Deinococcus cellulosilyticus (strain DSM 18568 / NBRC 106333 / KACC 11606 / 5516J-15) TaxID=1223518 RepID=A0A511NC60_DEIC1|nr:M20 family metallo-hydrolase [Deinococcus cellulosilyticus]GEM50088.1 putative hydrolase [Deinococcus cellulosilyticus NBRC 106333 = KACC 11606]
MTEMNIDIDALMHELEELAAFSDTPPPSVTRVLWTETDQKARAYLKRRIEEAGFSWREDAIGNIFATFEGKNPRLPKVGTGSHIDAIPHAGKYDGTVGVLGGLEAMRALKRSGFQPRRSIELLVFNAEEPTRFGVGCLGSRMLSGALKPEEALKFRDQDHMSFDDARAQGGFLGDLGKVQLSDQHYFAFVELHIEQMPNLEKAGLPIGVVTAIAAPSSFKLHLTGQGGHAGAVLMPDRKDAFLAASEIALCIEQAVKDHGTIDTVGTVGLVQVHPNAINSIPSKVELGVDLRDIEATRRDRVLQSLLQAAEDICLKRGIRMELEMLNQDPPSKSDPMLVKTIQSNCEKLGIPYQNMVSRAYHDSLFMARIAPTAMIFIPCKDGISHRPDEYASPEHIRTGVEVLAGVLRDLGEV